MDPGMETNAKASAIFDGFTVFGAWPNRPADIRVETLTATLDRHRVTRALTICAEAIQGDGMTGNDRAMAAAAKDARLVAVPVLNPACYPFCLNELERMGQQGRRLFATFPETQEWEPDCLAFRPTVEALAALGAGLMAEATRPSTVAGLLRAVAGHDLPLILVGANYRNLGEVLAAATVHPQVYVETHLLAAVGGLERCLQVLGEERVLFGSGAPLGYFSSAFLRARFAAVTPKQMANVLYGNTAALLERLGCP